MTSEEYPDKRGRAPFACVEWQFGQPNLNNPDTLEPMDSTELNRLHRLYQRDPKYDVEQQYEKQVSDMKAALNLIKTPFYMSPEEIKEAKDRWTRVGKSLRFPLLIKKSRRNYTIGNIDNIVEEQEEGDDDGGDKEQEEDAEAGAGSLLKKEADKRSATEKVEDVAADDRALVKEYVAVHKKYLLAHFGYYFAKKDFHFPSEFAMAEFSVQSGLGKIISGLIDIGTVPLGYNSDVREQIEETHLPYPGYNTDFDAYSDVLRRIEEFCKPHFAPDKPVLLFALKEHIPVIEDGIKWVTEYASLTGPVRELKYKIIPFSVLVQVLGNKSQDAPYRDKNNSEEYIINHDSFLDRFLHAKSYNDLPELGCTHHQKPDNSEGVVHCAESIVKRCAFNASHVLLSLYNIEPLLNYHYPKVYVKRRPLKVQECEDDDEYYKKYLNADGTSKYPSRPRGRNPLGSTTECDTDSANSTTATSTSASKSVVKPGKNPKDSTTTTKTAAAPSTTSDSQKSKEDSSKGSVSSTGFVFQDITLVLAEKGTYNRRRWNRGRFGEVEEPEMEGDGGRFTRQREEAELDIAGPSWDSKEVLKYFKVSEETKASEPGRSIQSSCHEESEDQSHTSSNPNPPAVMLRPTSKIITDAQKKGAVSDSESVSSVSDSVTSNESTPVQLAYGARGGAKGLPATTPLKPRNSYTKIADSIEILGKPIIPRGRGGPLCLRSKMGAQFSMEGSGRVPVSGRGHGAGSGLRSRRRPESDLDSTTSIQAITTTDPEDDTSSFETSSIGSSYFGHSSTCGEEEDEDEKVQDEAREISMKMSNLDGIGCSRGRGVPRK